MAFTNKPDLHVDPDEIDDAIALLDLHIEDIERSIRDFESGSLAPKFALYAIIFGLSPVFVYFGSDLMSRAGVYPVDVIVSLSVSLVGFFVFFAVFDYYRSLRSTKSMLTDLQFKCEQGNQYISTLASWADYADVSQIKSHIVTLKISQLKYLQNKVDRFRHRSVWLYPLR